MRSSRGFTLIELMITVAILAILLGVGVPSFVDYIRNSRTSTQVNELATALGFARSEAIARGVPVSVAAIDNVTLANGWCVFVGNGAAVVPDVCTPATEIRRFPTPLVDVALQAPPATPPRIPLPPVVAFDRLGRRIPPTPALAGELGVTVVPASCSMGSSLRARVLSISPGGRVAVERADCP